jgi:hypothetical protein
MSDSTAPAAPVKCKDCGFLSVRNRQTRELAEVESPHRESGHSPLMADLAKPVYDTRPICFVQAADLIKEQESGLPEPPQHPTRDDYVAQFLKVIQRDRECNRFTTAIHGHTPREHKDMIESREQRDWQEERLKADRKQQQDQREKDRQWQEDQREKDRQWQLDQKRRDRWWQIAMVVAAALLGWFFGRWR